MPIRYVCPHCGKETLVGDQFAGQSGPCGGCGQTITVPGFVPPASGGGGSKSTLIIVLAVVAVGALLCGGVLLALLLPAVQSAREAGRRATCTNNLKQLALAMHNYHDEKGHFPPAHTVDKDGKPLHSWRTLLLPYLEHQQLAQQIDMDEPWDSPKNQAIAGSALMKIFRCPSQPDTVGQTLTNYVVVTGPGTIFDNQKRTFADVTDGSSNTILIVEVDGLNIPWMKPQDIDINEFTGAKTGKSAAGSKHPNIFQVSLADGAVRQIRTKNISPEQLKALATRAGGEQISVNDL